MALVLCRLLGDGSRQDSFRANFPTYELVSHNVDSKLAIIRVPNSDIPEGLLSPPFNAPWVADGPVNVIRLVGNNARRVTELIQGRYREGFSQWDAANEEGI